MSQRRAREENVEEEVVEELGREEQQKADKALLTACELGSTQDVKLALRDGAMCSATVTGGRTGLALACLREDWDASLPVVKLLLSTGCFSVRASNDFGENALHAACCRSSGEVVRLLLEADPNAIAIPTANPKPNGVNGMTPLMGCCVRHDQEAAKIAALLLDRGCDVNAKRCDGLTALHCAARWGQTETVALLLARGADVQALSCSGRNALHCACLNGAFGRDIIPILCAAGVDVVVLDKHGASPFFNAVASSGAMAEALAPFVPEDFELEEPALCEADPVGSIVWSAKYGQRPSKSAFAKAEDSFHARWGHLRNGRPLRLDESEHDVFCALEQSSCVTLWKWASSELPHQHPVTGDTVFHLLCRSEAMDLQSKLLVLADLKLHYRDPLTPNFWNELCIDLTKDAKLKEALQPYMCWQPDKRVMEWFGPFFQKRSFALLLVCYRLKKCHPKRLAGLNKDIRHLLVLYMSRVEYIYCATH